MGKGFIYFMVFWDKRCKSLPSIVKIGCAVNPEKRLRHLQTSSPFKLKIIGLIELNEHVQVEAKLHAQFSSLRLKGEWFYLSKSMINAVRYEYNLSYDKFDDLILISEEEDGKITLLKSELSNLRKELDEKNKTILNLKSEINELNPHFNYPEKNGFVPQERKPDTCPDANRKRLQRWFRFVPKEE